MRHRLMKKKEKTDLSDTKQKKKKHFYSYGTRFELYSQRVLIAKF